MKLLISISLLFVSACSSTGASEFEREIHELVSTDPADHAPADAEEAHEWLLRLVGRWESTMGSWTITETVEPLGELWVVSRGEGPGTGAPFRSLTTFGFDPAEGAFVASYVDSMQTRLWTYRGFLNDERTALTLETEGPSMTDPSATALYRDVYSLEGDDKKRIVSSVRNTDGTWTPFVQMTGRRLP